MDEPELHAWIRARTGGGRVHGGHRVQTLWGGYGRIERHRVDGAAAGSVVAKVVRPPAHGAGPGHARKLRSYAVESAFYATFAGRLRGAARVPACLGAAERGGERWLLLEDLDGSGFPGRLRRLDAGALAACLAWLGAFHGTFLDTPPGPLWARGSYWHLGTRADEHAAMPPGPLRDAAARLDAALAACPVQTLLHGDAKPANFCFPPHHEGAVAAVDFQYVGGGVGVVDVVYLLSCMPARWRTRHLGAALDTYFEALRARAPGRGAAAEAAWRPLVDVAWADLARFLSGWCGEVWEADPDGAPRVRRALRAVGAPGPAPMDATPRRG